MGSISILCFFFFFLLRICGLAVSELPVMGSPWASLAVGYWAWTAWFCYIYIYIFFFSDFSSNFFWGFFFFFWLESRTDYRLCFFFLI